MWVCVQGGLCLSWIKYCFLRNSIINQSNAIWVFWTPSFWNHDLKTAKPPVSHISYTQGQFNLHGTDKHLRGGLRYRSYLPEGRQHTVIEIPGGCEIWVLSICRVETPCSLGRQHDTARHKMTHMDVHVHNTHTTYTYLDVEREIMIVFAADVLLTEQLPVWGWQRESSSSQSVSAGAAPALSEQNLNPGCPYRKDRGLLDGLGSVEKEMSPTLKSTAVLTAGRAKKDTPSRAKQAAKSRPCQVCGVLSP